jgi:hypothetical protein
LWPQARLADSPDPCNRSPWRSVASAVGYLSGGPYFAGHASADTSVYTYLSFITLATVGYGDYAPAQRLGRALAVVEGLMGQL